MDDVDNQAAKRFKDLLSSFGLHQHVHEPTHKHGHCLDLLITRDTTSLLSNIEIMPGLSDHCAVVCNINLQKPPLPTDMTWTLYRQQWTRSCSLHNGFYWSLDSLCNKIRNNKEVRVNQTLTYRSQVHGKNLIHIRKQLLNNHHLG